MTLVTKDATSGKWLPQSTAEATSLYASSTVAIPTLTALILCQEASGDLADSTGNSHTLIANGGGATYQNAVSGWATKAVNFTVGGTGRFIDGTWADVSSTIFAIVNFPALTPSQNSVITLGAIYSSQVAIDLHNGSNPLKVDLVTHGDTFTTSANATTGVHPIILTANKTAASGTLQTNLETLTHATTAGDSWGALTLGGDNSHFWTDPSAGYMHIQAWSGTTAAEFTSTQRATILDRFNNGPAVTSVAITPTSYSLAPLATQQMTATATRADGSTYDCTATATWLSSDPTKATVSATGLVTAVLAGTTGITASFTSYNAAAATSPAQTVTVSSGSVTLTSITLSGANSLGVGYTEQVTATGHYSDSSTADITGSAVWSTSTPLLLSVVAGLVTGVAAGTGSVTATVSAVNVTSTFTIDGNAQSLVDHVKSTLPRWLWRGKTAALEWLYAYRDIFDNSRAQGQYWLDMTYINSAVGAELDQHARDRGTTRRLNETDAALRTRLQNITDVITEPALKASVDLILAANSLSQSFWVVLRRDDIHLSRVDAFLSRGARVGRLVGMEYIVILPSSTPTNVKNAVSEYLRQYGPAGFLYTIEVGP